MSQLILYIYLEFVFLRIALKIFTLLQLNICLMALAVLAQILLLGNCFQVVTPSGELNTGFNIDLWSNYLSFILCWALTKEEWCYAQNVLAVVIWLFFTNNLNYFGLVNPVLVWCFFLYFYGLSYCSKKKKKEAFLCRNCLTKAIEFEIVLHHTTHASLKAPGTFLSVFFFIPDICLN